MRKITAALLDGIEDPHSAAGTKAIIDRTAVLNARVYELIEHQAQAKYDKSLNDSDKHREEIEAEDAFRDVAKCLGFEHLLRTSK